MFARRPLSADRLDELASLSDVIAQYLRRKRAEEALREAHDELERRVRERTAELATALVIDDDPAVGDLITRFLNREGYAVTTAGSGVEGIRLARQCRPVAITLDILLPDLDGWDTLRALKSAPDLADIPVIVLTFLDEKGKGFAMGAVDYLVKPIDPERLIAVLGEYKR